MYQSCLTEFIGWLGSALQASSMLITNAKVTVLISVTNTFPMLLLLLFFSLFLAANLFKLDFYYLEGGRPQLIF